MTDMRLPDGGRIDRGVRLSFTFDGERYTGHPGDTLASALLANGVHLVGRSFKYHRPRGFLGAGAEEPNALVQLEGPDGRSDPNMRATQVELYDGLRASSQNHAWSLEHDLLAANDLLSPLFPAGFYYKTFMWPARLWPRYERVIRHVAGLGRAPSEPDPDRYAHHHAHCDVLVVGAGPAGLMAALAAGRAGARVILCDEQPEPGGSLLAEGEDVRIGGAVPAAWVEGVVAELAALPELRVLPRTTASAYHDHGYVALCERVTDHLPPGSAPQLPRQRLWLVRARQVVLATGAIERPLLFDGNDRPGVMLASAARTWVRRYAVRPGTRAVVVTGNDSAYATALDLHAAGLSIAAVVDLRERAPGALPQQARARGLRVLTGHAVVAATGRKRVHKIRIQRLDGERPIGETTSYTVDVVAMSGGWNPSVHLHSQSRGRLRWDADAGMFLPCRSVAATRSVGACNGTFALAALLHEAAEAGAGAAGDCGFTAAVPTPPEVEEPAEDRAAPIWIVPSPGGRRPRKAFVDFQNDVTVKDLELALREGYGSIELVKRYTTTGMGTDQGKTSSVNALALVAAGLGQPIGQVGHTTFRPPYTPLTFGAIVGANCGPLFEPVRRTAIHPWHEEAGAVFEDVGQWKRPWYFPRPGEDMHDAVQRECKAVRDGLGVMDASTLGKIDIQGPDAAEFLNRIYTNAWSRLEVGRCRYGLMLTDDGMVMDDGVTSRLDEHRYLMTTTTGGAARVMAWLEEWLQTEWPELQVYCTSVTEQWATIGLAGPSARKALAPIAEGIDLGPEAFPFMAVREGRVAGVPARVARISFTGELSFEVNVPAGYGRRVWEACMEAGEPYGITPFGTETMHVLRAEKGFIIVGQETDGMVTPYDLGMGWIVSRTKPDFIGKRSLARPDMLREDRRQLVGLLPEDPHVVLEEGAQVVAEVHEEPPMPMIGNVTSSYMSPNLGRSFALAMVEGGRGRIGDRLFVPMADRTIAVQVTGPVFLDPDGERMRA
jgi:sarcosine oxidase, subunit alpha